MGKYLLVSNAEITSEVRLTSYILHDRRQTIRYSPQKKTMRIADVPLQICPTGAGVCAFRFRAVEPIPVDQYPSTLISNDPDAPEEEQSLLNHIIRLK